MATYTELYDLRTDSALRNRVAVACVVAAETVRLESPSVENHANRLAWAARTVADPETSARRMLWLLLAGNRAADVAAIRAATDEAIQAKVDAAVNLFAAGE